MQLGARMKADADGAVSELCAVMTSVTEIPAERRQYAAVILRKRFGRAATWNKLSAESKVRFLQGVPSGHRVE